MTTNQEKPIALFLFAHQDDEFGVFAQLERESLAGNQVYCIYVTDGAATASPAQRNAESISVLLKLGVPRDNIFFIGQELKITDGKLYCNTKNLIIWLTRFLDNKKTISSCYVPAWEGGHPDHDMLHAITILLMERCNKLASVRQYSLYNGFGVSGSFFRVMSALKENGAVESLYIPWRSRIKYLRLCLSYPSQWKTWMGLFPFISMKLLYQGSQQLQPVKIERLESPPHYGRLYYERRSFAEWQDFKKELEKTKKIINT